MRRGHAERERHVTERLDALWRRGPPAYRVVKALEYRHDEGKDLPRQEHGRPREPLCARHRPSPSFAATRTKLRTARAKPPRDLAYDGLHPHAPPLMQNSRPGCSGANANFARHGLREPERIGVESTAGLDRSSSGCARPASSSYARCLSVTNKRQVVLRRRVILRCAYGARAPRSAKRSIEAPRRQRRRPSFVERFDPLGRRTLVARGRARAHTTRGCAWRRPTPTAVRPRRATRAQRAPKAKCSSGERRLLTEICSHGHVGRGSINDSGIQAPWSRPRSRLEPRADVGAAEERDDVARELRADPVRVTQPVEHRRESRRSRGSCRVARRPRPRSSACRSERRPRPRPVGGGNFGPSCARNRRAALSATAEHRRAVRYEQGRHASHVPLCACHGHEG